MGLIETKMKESTISTSSWLWKNEKGKKPENKEMDDPIQVYVRLGLHDTMATYFQFTWSNGTMFSKIDRTMEFSNISLRAKKATKKLEELQTRADKDVGNVVIQA
ncbi:hypothetical protein AAHA92_15270 [Salvia divinorum]|uniref:Uncharacterized protein n=1 Tax=Salvia divinorum TaxID=28513 RepID=A0ABD1HE82_SALDI